MRGNAVTTSLRRPTATVNEGAPAIATTHLGANESSPTWQPASRPGIGRRIARGGLEVLWRTWFLAALIGTWWMLSAHSTSIYFPPLSKIVHRTWKLWVLGDAKHDLWSSLQHFAVGYALAAVIGVFGGALLWHFRRFSEAVSPLLYFIYVIPAAALLPALVAVMGIGASMKITIIVLASLWPTLLNTLDGMRGVDSVQLDTAKALHMRPARTVWSVVLPAALPQIMAGLRNSLQIAIVMMVVSELIASTTGIGFFILDAQQRFAITDMWTGIVVLAVVGSALTLVFVALERVVLRWYIGSRAVEEKR